MNVNEIPILNKSLDLVDFLRDSLAPVSFSKLSAQLNIPRTTLFRILSSLGKHDMVTRLSGRKGYSLGPSLYALKSSFSINNLIQKFSPTLRRLADSTGTSAKISVISGDKAVVIDRQELLSGFGPSGGSVGASFPLHAGGASKILLAFGNIKVRKKYLNQSEFERFTENTITCPRVLRTELEEVRLEGVAWDRGEFRNEVGSVATPIGAQDSPDLAAVSLVFFNSIDVSEKKRCRDLLLRETRPYFISSSSATAQENKT